MKKICLKEIISTMSEKEMKNIVGGTGSYVGGEGGASNSCVMSMNTGSRKCSGTCSTLHKYYGYPVSGRCIVRNASFYQGDTLREVYSCDCTSD